MARALAVIGMILVNYKLAMDPQAAEPGWLHATTGILEGRASALFVILAGIGVSLMTAKARASEEETLITISERCVSVCYRHDFAAHRLECRHSALLCGLPCHCRCVNQDIQLTSTHQYNRHSDRVDPSTIYVGLQLWLVGKLPLI
ncbi:hypothetical protein ACN9MH_14815 [Paenibacillus silvae]|uniref:hypothetical protein n=1 Tax=Paenibacillus silvae TaxID=1325358 RepID=UPI003CF8BAE0